MHDLIQHQVEVYCKPHQRLVFESHYGNPTMWPELHSLVQNLLSEQKRVDIICTGKITNLHAAKHLALHGAQYILKIDGYENAGKVYLGATKLDIDSAVSALGENLIVIVDQYAHNQFDSYNIIADHCTVIKRSGPLYGGDIAPVVDSTGEWLYDVRSCNSPPALNRSMRGHEMLRYYVKPITGVSIINIPATLPKKFSYHAQPVQDQDLYISADNILHPNRTHWENWSSALCSDWRVDHFDLRKKHEAETAGILYKYSKINYLDLLVAWKDQATITASASWQKLIDPKLIRSDL
jgi:hypothetical protein